MFVFTSDFIKTTLRGRNSAKRAASDRLYKTDRAIVSVAINKRTLPFSQRTRFDAQSYWKWMKFIAIHYT
jgi:hypothetical protein